MSTPTARPQEQLELLALRLGVVAAAVSTLGSLAYNQGYSRLVILGWHSIVAPITAAALIFTIISFTIGYHRGLRYHHTLKRDRMPWARRRYLNGLSLALAYGIFAAGIAVAGAMVMNSAFKGLTLTWYYSALFSGLFGAVVAHRMIHVGFSINSEAIMRVLLSFLSAGVLLSMATNSDPLWWQNNFSFLGRVSSNTFIPFNLTLICSGLIMLAFTDYLFEDLKEAIAGSTLTISNFFILRAFFVAIAVCMAGIGIFPYWEGTIVAHLHMVFANLLVIGFLGVIFGIRQLLPGFPQTFYFITHGFGAVLIILFYFWKFPYDVTTTAFELSSFVICFTWLYLFFQTVIARKRDLEVAA